MRKITEVLRLKAAGISIRDIALSVGAGRTTIFEYLSGGWASRPKRRRARGHQRAYLVCVCRLT